VLRLAFGATLGFAIAVALDWEFSFLAPMLAVQMLAAMPQPPGLRQGLAIPLVIYGSTSAALAATNLLGDAPAALLAVIGLVIFTTFYAQRRGGPAIVMLLIQVAFCGVPLASTVSLDLGHTLAEFLQRGSIAAVATVWISHALFPAPTPAPRPAQAPAPPGGLSPGHALRVAVSDAIVLLPLLAGFMIDRDISNLVILITTINLIREVQPDAGGRAAIGLLAGNLLGGVLAVGAQQLVFVADNLVFFLVTVFLAGLGFASRLVRGGPTAPIVGLAFATFLLLLGLAITPLPGGSGEIFVLRILKIGLASLYVLGALSLVAGMRRPAGR